MLHPGRDIRHCCWQLIVQPEQITKTTKGSPATWMQWIQGVRWWAGEKAWPWVGNSIQWVLFTLTDLCVGKPLAGMKLSKGKGCGTIPRRGRGQGNRKKRGVREGLMCRSKVLPFIGAGSPVASQSQVQFHGKYKASRCCLVSKSVYLGFI